MPAKPRAVRLSGLIQWGIRVAAHTKNLRSIPDVKLSWMRVALLNSLGCSAGSASPRAFRTGDLPGSMQNCVAFIYLSSVGFFSVVKTFQFELVCFCFPAAA